MNSKEFIIELNKIFVENTECGLQDNGQRCCNTCFHAQRGDFKHITWLIILGLNKSYAEQREEILKDIKKELKEVD